MENNSVIGTKVTFEELQKLAEVHNTHCVSLYIPTHSSGEETLKGADAIILKNQLKEVRTKLEERGMSSEVISGFVKPIDDLITDSNFWRNQSDGLCIFLSDSDFRYYTLPIRFEEYNYVSTEYYLKPLIPLLTDDGRFYLLTLGKENIMLYACTKHGLAEIEVDDKIPSRLEDVVGYDYEQSSLQFRTQQGNKGAGSFHGHQDLDSTEKVELREFFRAVDKGISGILNEKQTAPLVVCSLDEHFAIYKKVNSYKNLFSSNISRSPSQKDIGLIHREAWDLLQPYFDDDQQKIADKFAADFEKGKSSAELKDIFSATFAGKVDTLLIEKGADVFGTYDPTTGELQVDEAHHSPNVSLTNLLAMKVMSSGGQVYLLDKEKMPLNTSVVNALFRY